MSTWKKIIPQTDQIKFLGINFDRTLSFNSCFQEIKAKCHKRHFIKILKRKSWELSSNTLENIYYALIRSIIDYASTIFEILSETKKKGLRSIQYHALRLAYNKPIKFSHKVLLKIANVKSIDDSCKELNEKYIEKVFLFNNELTMETIKYYLNIYPDSREPKFKTFYVIIEIFASTILANHKEQYSH